MQRSGASVATPAILDVDPRILAQDRQLGSMTNAAIAAFASRLNALQGVSDREREAVQTSWLRGYGHPLLTGLSTAVGNMLPAGDTCIFYRMEALVGVDIDAIPHGRGYGVRGVGQATSDKDLVAISDTLRNENLEAIFAQRRKAGLPIPHTVRESDFHKYRGELERAYGAPEMFMRDAEHPDRRSYQVAQIVNNKLKAVEICMRIGVPVPPTRYMGPAIEFEFGHIRSLPIILKREVSAGGIGVTKHESWGSVRAKLSTFSPVDPIQVQDFLEGDDISFLFYCDGKGGAHIFSTSEQDMSGTEHMGNFIPGAQSFIKPEHAEAMLKFAKEASRMGFVGQLGVDARIVKDTGDCVFIECNPRRTAVSTPSVIATQLGVSHFSHRQMTFASKAGLDATLGRFGFHSAGREGVMITTYLGNPGEAYKSEFVFLSPGDDAGRRLRSEVLRFARDNHFLVEKKAK